jgi:hypothetical protein
MSDLLNTFLMFVLCFPQVVLGFKKNRRAKTRGQTPRRKQTGEKTPGDKTPGENKQAKPTI